MRISPKLSAGVLLGLAVFLALQRFCTYNEPPEWDIGTYSVVGHELNLGSRLYSDIWDMKPPAIFATYALAERITGYGPGQIYFLSVSAAVITMLGVYAAASVRGTAAGLWAAVIWSAAAFDVASGASLPNTEVFINAAIIWAVAIVFRLNTIRRTWVWTIAAGALFGAASLYKQVAVAPAMFLTLGYVLLADKSQRKRAILQAISIGSLGLAVWGLTFLYFAITNRAWIFYNTNFVFARYYGGNTGLNLLASLKPSNLFSPQLVTLAPLAAAGLSLLLVGPWRRPQRDSAILIFWAIGTQIAVGMIGKFSFLHYYELWMPLLAVTGGWTFQRLSELTAARRWVVATLGAVLVTSLIQPQIRWYGLSPDEFIKQRYNGFFYNTYLDAKLISSISQPGERPFIWSDEIWMYWQTRLRPPTTPLFKMHTDQGPLATWLSDRAAAQLREHPPELIVDWPNDLVTAEHPIARVIAELYRPAPELGARMPLVFYVRKGGRLDQPR